MTPRAHCVGLAATVVLALVAADHARVPVSGSLFESPAVAPAVLPALSSEAVAAGATADWWSQVHADLAVREYEASVSAAGLQAPNRAQNLRTYFRSGGIEVVPRTDGGEPAWRLALTVRHSGRPGAMVDVPPAEPDAAGARVSYARPGFVEWYENRRDGLEQGFTVEHAPVGAGPLRIESELGGTRLRAEQTDDYCTVRFINARGMVVLEYGKVAVWDAAGRELAARLEVGEGRLGIVVADAGARYPITVDPVMTTPAWAIVGDQDDKLGFCVAPAGDVNADGFSDVIVGCPGRNLDQGCVWVYYGSAAGLSSSDSWTAAGEETGDWFGSRVASAGDVNRDGYADIIVGALYLRRRRPREGLCVPWIGVGGCRDAIVDRGGRRVEPPRGERGDCR